MSDARQVVRAGMLFRSLLIQGAWNYGTMLGPGFAFTLLPVLRRVHAEDPAALASSIERHAEHFNAHPYLASVALGAVARMESDGADNETVRRFKTALRGPLGGLGDTLVWATWLPLVAVGALVLYWFGVPGWVATLTFVVVYNVGHLGLRAWGLRLGLEAGRDVGTRLTEADLGGWARRLQHLLVLGLGVLSGTILGAPDGLGSFGPVVAGLAVVGFVAGLVGGHRAWRPAAAVMVVVIALIGAWGILS
ncbi:MAG: PTS system mannose/fructose/sorbose family transporter subunit IID [Longimicrobiales bacterium]|nr:PTS system mannose/fructose/sorbose family transporter subunit IID [Longimicrobiales bacterium]